MKKVRTHVIKHKTLYSGIGLGVLAGVTGTLIFTRTSAGNTAVQKVIAFKTGDVTQNVIQQLARRGHPGIVVRCVETGESFASIRRASDILSIDRSSLQRHLQGLKEHAGGFTFEILGEASA